jgi:hypothetical protein
LYGERSQNVRVHQDNLNLASRSNVRTVLAVFGGGTHRA